MLNLGKFEQIFFKELHHWAIPVLRVSLGIVFLWFGALKLIGHSPIEYVITQTYSLLPAEEFILILGVWEMLIGIGLIFKIALRTTLVLLWIQMAGTILSPLFNPGLFFDDNIFFLTTEGEFVVKNFVLVAASMVIGGYEIHKKPH